jgi:hypothetical protein
MRFGKFRVSLGTVKRASFRNSSAFHFFLNIKKLRSLGGRMSGKSRTVAAVLADGREIGTLSEQVRG